MSHVIHLEQARLANFLAGPANPIAPESAADDNTYRQDKFAALAA